MSALSIQPTYPIFTDIDGQPLEDGYIWIGTANLDPQTNPINVYWDDALTQLAAQPIRTRGGYPVNAGTPARLYVNSDYSIRVTNKNGAAIYNAPEATERISNAIISQIDSSLVNYTPAGTGAVPTTVQSKLRETVSVFDFMTPAQIAAVQAGTSTDDTAAIQAAFDAALTLNKAVFIPSGIYLTGPLNFGTNTIGAQSSSPPALFGEGGTSVLKAKSGVTDTILNARNTVGTNFKDFVVDCNSVSGTGIDTSWHGSGPSLYNKYERVIVQNYTNAGWIATNNNDCSFDSCMVRTPKSSAAIAFSLKSPGGLVYMKDCIWPDALLYLGAQNYVLTGCWGHGIIFATGAENAGVINGGYLYSNTLTNAIFTSEAFTAGNKVESMTLNGCWLDLLNGTKSVFNVRAAGKISLNSCVIVPISGTPQLLSSSCVPDTGKVFVNFEGGRVSAGSILGTTYPENFVVVKNNFNNQGVVENNTSGSFTPVLAFGGNTTGITYSNAVGRYSVRDGFCFFQIFITLTNKGSATGGASVFGVPYTSNASAPDSIVQVMAQNVTYSGSLIGFVGTNSTGITIFTQQSGGGVTQIGDGSFANNSDLRISGMIAL